jgi:hypothetical protein
MGLGQGWGGTNHEKMPFISKHLRYYIVFRDIA